MSAQDMAASLRTELTGRPLVRLPYFFPRGNMHHAAKSLRWRGNVPPQKWMNFYTKVLSRFASTPGLRLTVSFEVPPESNVTKAQIEETRTALRELGLEENLEL